MSKALVFLIVLYASSYRWVHFSRAVLSLCVFSGFLDKGPASRHPFAKPLSSVLCPDYEHGFLCPVWALWRYWPVTKPARVSGIRRLFVSLNPDHEKDIRCPTLPQRISETVTFAYDKQWVAAPSHRAHGVALGPLPWHSHTPFLWVPPWTWFGDAQRALLSPVIFEMLAASRKRIPSNCLLGRGSLVCLFLLCKPTFGVAPFCICETW